MSEGNNNQNNNNNYNNNKFHNNKKYNNNKNKKEGNHKNYKKNYNYNNNNKFNYNNNNNNNNDNNNNNNYYYNENYNEEEYYENDNYNNNYYNNYNNNYNYNKNYNRHKNDPFFKDTHKNQHNKKREHNRKLYLENKEKKKTEEYIQQQQQNEIKKVIENNIDPNYSKENERIKGKLLDIELKQEEEINKEYNDAQREKIKNIITETYEQQKEIIKSMTKNDSDKKANNIFEGQNILQKIVYNNEIFNNRPELLFNLINIFNSLNKLDLQSEITDLLGYEQMDTISELIQNKNEIIELITVAKAAIDDKLKLEKKQENLQLYGNLSNIGDVEIIKRKKKNTNNTNNTLTQLQETQRENYLILKELGFNSKYLNFYQNDDENTNKNNNVKDFSYVEPNPVKQFYNNEMNYYELHDKELYSTEEIDKYNHKIVNVEPILKEREKTELLPIKNVLPPWAKKCFNFFNFNEIQSIVFDKSYNSDENLLIAAPTGAGKTNIALLTILREINKELKKKGYDYNKLPESYDFTNIKWDFKLLYLVPLKALANEIVNKFNNQLKFLNIVINEFSGDVNLTRDQIDKTNLFIGIPEKWDLFTRKNDMILNNSLKLMIIDEVHLLNEDRGRVLECIVARTLRKCELNQKFIRLVGLSATLPNYKDVAEFLRVKEGLFSFDTSYRSTPLSMKFFGIKEFIGDKKIKFSEYKQIENEITYDEIKKYLNENKQVLVFIHSRIETYNFCKELIRLAEMNNELNIFKTEKLKDYKDFKNIQNKHLQELIPYGLGFHNAGVLRKDRNIIEKMFQKGVINVLVSTTTLAWGVNLPAYACIIKGTTYYDAKEGKDIDISILDIQQMFGRAGRVDFDDKGIGIIISPQKKINKFIQLLKNQINIESTLDLFLEDALNAEIAIKNINSIDDALNWIKLTYLSVRLCSRKKNKNLDVIEGYIQRAFKNLNRCKLIRYVKKTGQVYCTELGRIASNYYMNYLTIDKFYNELKEGLNEKSFLNVFAQSSEFENMKVYEEEKKELLTLDEKLDLISKNKLQIITVDDIPKPITLLYTYLKMFGYEFKNSSLFMDSAYVIDNAPRIIRAMMEICLHKHFIETTTLCFNWMKYIERRVPPNTNPLWQFTYESLNTKANKGKKKVRGEISKENCYKIDNANLIQIEDIENEDISTLSSLLNLSKPAVKDIYKLLNVIPNFHIKVESKPLTRTILNISITLTPNFRWVKKYNGYAESFWVIIDNQTEIIHYENFLLTPKANEKRELKEYVFTCAVPFDIEPGERHARIDKVYIINIISDKWVGCQFTEIINLSEIEVPEDLDVKTELLDLLPLSLSALHKREYEKIFEKSFKYFNPVQTQVFYSVYNSDENILCGAPTGSGKTAIAELAILRVFENNPQGKIIYIAPLKSLGKERVLDWKEKFGFLNKTVLEISGDFTPDLEMLTNSDILITTPEKWDGISRNWHHRIYVKKVSLIIIDEIHLLGLERGPIIEVIVSRMRFMANKLNTNIRFIGLSTALANSVDVAEWLGLSIKYDNKRAPGLFNFRPAVRPCPVTVHIESFSEKKYCPRMATMNKPCYNAIVNFSDNKPVLVFVSSRRQTRLTAFDLIALASSSNLTGFSNFLNVPIDDILPEISECEDEDLKHCLSFGIGLHHAGLIEKDRKISEKLFLEQKIQILIATSTLAWGVNFPAHLVIIKGTEYRHHIKGCYVDMPITDILQMIGRAGRPQYDNEAVACLFVRDDVKNFFKKFLYEPFPLESHLHEFLTDHINAEISSGSLTSKLLCVEYIKWTYFFKRLVKNPSYYGLKEANNAKALNEYLKNLINNVLEELEKAGCIKIDDKDDTIKCTFLGDLASFYYTNYRTARDFNEKLKSNLSIFELMTILCYAKEYEGIPVRHTEDILNKELAQDLPLKDIKLDYQSQYVKSIILIQAHLSRVPMPISDYILDLKTVLDNSIRLLLIMADICYNKGKCLDSLLNILLLIQMIMQGIWENDCSLKALPSLTMSDIRKIIKLGNIHHICELCEMYHSTKDIVKFLKEECKINNMPNDEFENLINVIGKLPILDVSYKLYALSQTNERIYDKPIIELSDVQILLSLTKKNDVKNNLIVHSRFGKIKNCRWFIVIGNIKTNEILAFEKVSFKEHLHRKINFIAPKEIDNDSLVLYILSDSYFGLDQQYYLKLLDINEGIKKRFGIYEIKTKENYYKGEKEKKETEQSEFGDDKETNKDDEEEEDEDTYFENW